MEWSRAETSDMRVKAYNIHGERLGVAGVGKGHQRLTFPSRLKVEQVLGFDHWIKEAPPDAEKWYESLGAWRPRVVVFANGRIANPEDPIGMAGDTVTVLDTSVTRIDWTTRDSQDLSGIRTPRTPSETSSEHSYTAFPIHVLSDGSSPLEYTTAAGADNAAEQRLRGGRAIADQLPSADDVTREA